MSESISKLSPHRDLQCYFLTPSAVAALSGATETGLTLSGKWRQQFDWAVVEWSRDNTFEHPTLRNLPDGDLSGLKLTYVEQRTTCIPIESNLVPVVDWNNLRLWAADDQGNEQLYHIPLAPLATPSEGDYVAASATMTLTSIPAAGNRVGLALLESHHYYVVQSGDALAEVAAGIATAINGSGNIIGNPDFSATSAGPSVTLTWKPGGAYPGLLGANGNRITVYGFSQDGAQVWSEPCTTFSGGEFPTSYQLTIDFGALKAQGYPTDRVRKLRWTWAPDLQDSSFVQQEFSVVVSDWTVSGANAIYSFAGPGSRRIEDTDNSVQYSGTWTLDTGNYSGSKIHWSSITGDSLSITYAETAEHELYLGTRRYAASADLSIAVDGTNVAMGSMALPGEDVMVRLSLGHMAAGNHTITIAHQGAAGTVCYFDFLEIAYPSQILPEFQPQQHLTLATDWDTYHSQALPAERTAWIIQKLGFQGCVNHYAGALWFGELLRPGMQYANTTLSFSPQSFDGSPTVVLDISANNASETTKISHLVLFDDTPETVVIALAGLINLATNLVWATANGNQLTLTARALGTAGNGITAALDAASQGYTTAGNTVLAGGVDGAAYGLDGTDGLNQTLIATADYWRTDLTATPRLNRAARDWHSSYFAALKGYAIDVVASFSTELLSVDPSLQTGMAQRYPDGTPVVLNTPAIQTNFSPAALAYWSQTYADMAGLQNAAGLQPYLQFGEVQWWYFPKQAVDPATGTAMDVGMPLYDAYTTQQFQSQYGRALPVIANNGADPSQYSQELNFLSGLIGTHTASIRKAVTSQYPNARFEVLYPTDTNSTAFNSALNFPAEDWTAANLNTLKTESFSFTATLRLDLTSTSIATSAGKGFPNSQRCHLVGISDAWTSWGKEVDQALSEGLACVVLFALDQYCLVGYGPPPFVPYSRSSRQG